MTTFTFALRLTHPDRRELSVPLDLSVDTEAVYVLLSAPIVADAGIPAVDEWAPNPAGEDRLVYRIGEVRMRFEGREIRTIFVPGPEGGPSGIAAFAIETFAPTH